jgi:2-polyprenyl-3-methyl-5-hydroxy-6-metoxy-1,4-benzoquinol methylase
MSYSNKYYQSINKEEKHQAEMLAKLVNQYYSPSSVVDAGCGTGLYLLPFNCKTLGFDINLHPINDKLNLKKLSLTEPLNLEMFDVCLCLEVLEHIEEEDADMAINNLKMLSDTLIISAALPNQPGENHINCQPMSYWEEKLLPYKRNYLNEFWFTYYLDKVPHAHWIIRNLMIFENEH